MRIFRAWQSGYKTTNMVLGSVWGLGMGTSLYPWGWGVLTRGRPPQPWWALFIDEAAGSVKWERSSLSILSVAGVWLPLAVLSICFCQALRNSRHHCAGMLFRDRNWEGPGYDCRKELEIHPHSLKLLFYVLFLPFHISSFLRRRPHSSQSCLWEGSGSLGGDVSCLHSDLRVWIIRDRSSRSCDCQASRMKCRNFWRFKRK